MKILAQVLPLSIALLTAGMGPALDAGTTATRDDVEFAQSTSLRKPFPSKAGSELFPNRTDVLRDRSQAKKVPCRWVTSISQPGPQIPRTVPDGSYELFVCFIVEKDGSVRDAAVVDGTPNERVNQACLAMVRKWRFSPAINGGVPVAAFMIQPFRFAIGKAAQRALPRDSLDYHLTAYSDGVTQITPESKIYIQVDEQCPPEHREELDRVVEVAQNQGLKCVPREDAEFELTVGFLSGPKERHPEGYTMFGLSGTLVPLLDHGARLRECSAWEGAVNAQKGSIFDRNLKPPYIQVEEVAERLFGIIGVEIPEPAANAAFLGGEDKPNVLTGASAEITNPPVPSVKGQPKTEDFNALARSFFQLESFDFVKVPFERSFVDRFRGRTANDVYRELKLREREFGGAVQVSPQSSGREFIIGVALRMVEQRGSKRSLYSRYLLIRYSTANMFRGVDRGMFFKQEF